MITRDEKHNAKEKALALLAKIKEQQADSKARWIRIDDKTTVKVNTTLTDAAYRSRYAAKTNKKI